MRRGTLVLGGVAVVLAAADLTHKAISEAQYFHSRPPAYAAFVVALMLAWAVAILATRSLSMALGGGVVTGGALGNVVSLAVWPGVPNPIELAPIAFNLADVFVVTGFALTALAALGVALRNRDRLREPVRLR